MKTIRIISGTYGFHSPKSRTVRAIAPSDGAFDVPDAEADRLVALKVAAYVDEVAVVAEPEGSGGSDGDGDPHDDGDKTPAKPEYSEDMDIGMLKSIAQSYGIAVEPKAGKSAIVAALDKQFAELPDASAGGDVVQ